MRSGWNMHSLHDQYRGSSSLIVSKLILPGRRHPHTPYAEMFLSVVMIRYLRCKLANNWKI